MKNKKLIDEYKKAQEKDLKIACPWRDRYFMNYLITSMINQKQ